MDWTIWEPGPGYSIWAVGFFDHEMTWVEDSKHLGGNPGQCLSGDRDFLNGTSVPLTDKDKAVRAAELLNQCTISTDIVNVFVNELDLVVMKAMQAAANRGEQ